MTQFSIPNASAVGSLTFDKIVTVDISAFDNPGDYISLSLPELPLSDLDLSQTYVDFTSNSKGDFGIGPTDQVPLSYGQIQVETLWPSLELFPSAALYPQGIGISPSEALFLGEEVFPEDEVIGEEEKVDVELNIPTIGLATIDKSKITGVRFRLFAKNLCTFRCLSIRACAADWTFAPIDIDTLWHRVHRPPSTNGSVLQTSVFPKAEGKEWPIMFRANPLSGLSDPKPVNLSVSASIHTGSYGQATGSNSDYNEFAFYFRDVPTDNQTMIELNSMTQGQLDSHGSQLDFGKALYDSRTQELLDIQDQEELEGQTQFNLERTPDESEHTWLEVKLRWSGVQANNRLTIHDADGIGYEFTNFPIHASNHLALDEGNYILLVDLKQSTVRAQIYTLNQIGEINDSSRILDTGTIFDDTLIKRRKGRFGWWSSLLDGDAYIHSVKTRGTNFGELVSKEFQSITPLKGVSLYAGSTEDHRLVSSIEPTDRTNTTVTLDPAATATGKAFKVTTTPLKPLQGITTNPFLIDDPKNIQISFDIKFPSSEIPGGGLSIFLLGEFEDIIPVSISDFTKDNWAHIKLSLTEDLFQTGNYQLVLMQTFPVVATSWWIENLSVKAYSVKWSARPKKSDAWNIEGDRWQEAGFTLNSLNGGLVFEEPGNGLQIRAQALRQDAVINDFKAVPQYATLGRRVYADEFKQHLIPEPKLKITPTIIEHNVSFVASHEAASIELVSYYWDFGDGSYDSGLVVSHFYKRSGTYVVTLTAKTPEGVASSVQKTITIT